MMCSRPVVLIREQLAIDLSFLADLEKAGFNVEAVLHNHRVLEVMRCDNCLCSCVHPTTLIEHDGRILRSICVHADDCDGHVWLQFSSYKGTCSGHTEKKVNYLSHSDWCPTRTNAQQRTAGRAGPTLIPSQT